MSLTRVASALFLFLAVAILPAQIGNFPQSEATGINNMGQVVGWSQERDGELHAWIWDGGFVTDLGSLPPVVSAATAINEQGLVVGYGGISSTLAQALFWRDRVPVNIVPFGGLPNTASKATAVNANGIIVGWASQGFDLNERAFVFVNRMIDLTPLVGDFTIATAINNRGDIVGTKAGEWGFLIRDGFVTILRSPDFTITTPKGINERGQIALTASGPPSFNAQAFLWERGDFRELGTLGGTESEAMAINISGQIAGGSRLSNGDMHAFLWTDGSMRDLGTLGGRNSVALALNDFGDVVGRSETRFGTSHAFLWRDGRMIDLGLVVGPQ